MSNVTKSQSTDIKPNTEIRETKDIKIIKISNELKGDILNKNTKVGIAQINEHETTETPTPPQSEINVTFQDCPQKPLEQPRLESNRVRNDVPLHISPHVSPHFSPQIDAADVEDQVIRYMKSLNLNGASRASSVSNASDGLSMVTRANNRILSPAFASQLPEPFQPTALVSPIYYSSGATSTPMYMGHYPSQGFNFTHPDIRNNIVMPPNCQIVSPVDCNKAFFPITPTHFNPNTMTPGQTMQTNNFQFSAPPSPANAFPINFGFDTGYLLTSPAEVQHHQTPDRHLRRQGNMDFNSSILSPPSHAAASPVHCRPAMNHPHHPNHSVSPGYEHWIQGDNRRVSGPYMPFSALKKIRNKKMRNSHNKSITVDKIRNNVTKMAKTREGSKCLQDKINSDDMELFDVIFSEVNQGIVELSTHIFANYLVQEVLKNCNEEEFIMLVNNMAPSVIGIATNQHGSRVMQKAVIVATSRRKKLTIVNALNMHVISTLLHDPSGAHVVKLMMKILPIPLLNDVLLSIKSEMPNILDTSCGLALMKDALSLSFRDLYMNCSQMSTHNRVREADSVHGSQFIEICLAVLSNLRTLTNHKWGNYVVQDMLQILHGAANNLKIWHRSGPKTVNFHHYVLHAVHNVFAGSYVQLAVKKFSSNVVDKMLHSAVKTISSSIVDELLCDNQRFIYVIKDQYGNYVMQNALAACSPEQRKRFEGLLSWVLPSFDRPVATKWKKLVNVAKKGGESYVSPHKMQGQHRFY